MMTLPREMRAAMRIISISAISWSRVLIDSILQYACNDFVMRVRGQAAATLHHENHGGYAVRAIITVTLISLIAATNAFARPDTISVGANSGTPIILGQSGKGSNIVAATIEDGIAVAERENAMLMLSIRMPGDLVEIKSSVKRAIDRKVDLLLEGEPDLIRQAQPDSVGIWTSGRALFISSRDERKGILIIPIDGGKSATKDILPAIAKIRAQLGSKNSISRHPGITIAPRAQSNRLGTDQKSWSFKIPSLVASSPIDVCTSIRKEVVSLAQQNNIPLNGDLNDAINSTCQAGTIGNFAAAKPVQKYPASYQKSVQIQDSDLVLNLSEEYLLLKSIDPGTPENSRLYFWVKTLGDGSGSGFTFSRRSHFTMAMEAWITTGWGPAVMPMKWEQSPFSYQNYLCDYFNGQPHGHTCPNDVRLISFQPSDSFNDTINVTDSQGWNIGGTLTVGAGAGDKGIAPNVSLALTGGYTQTTSRSVTLKMSTTRTNADTVYSRTVAWIPNGSAIRSYLDTVGGDIALATPLAATLNPQLSALWAIPLERNRGRTIAYSTQYNAKTVMCGLGDTCSGYAGRNGITVFSGSQSFWANPYPLYVHVPR
ncbi:hypothetical protein [Burkholderia ubonensis]|uniref:hypothetical protein n=1 Tax=Burkholderia ubonensis TaxID=101571 RepID=UPI0012F9A783|nr:hypothetical protein [Burkholderia ubonensis]